MAKKVRAKDHRVSGHGSLDIRAIIFANTVKVPLSPLSVTPPL